MRLTELKLPLDHSEPELRSAIVKRLGIAPEDLAGYTIFRRSHDARKPSAIVFTYTLDLELKLPLAQFVEEIDRVADFAEEIDTELRATRMAGQATAGVRDTH